MLFQVQFNYYFFTFKFQNTLNLILLKRRNFIYLTGVGAAASMMPIKVYVSKVR